MSDWKISQSRDSEVVIRKVPADVLVCNERKMIYEDSRFALEILYHSPIRGVPKLLGYDIRFDPEFHGRFLVFNAFGVAYHEWIKTKAPEEKLDENALRLLVYRDGDRSNYLVVGRWRTPAVEVPVDGN